MTKPGRKFTNGRGEGKDDAYAGSNLTSWTYRDATPKGERVDGSAPSEPRIYLQDPDFTLYNGDAREVLRELPAESVHMCVTSPPFFGLRDYGTGTWEGGDAECDHLKVSDPIAANASSGLQGGKKSNGHVQEGFGATCGKCGARRIDRQIGLESTPEEWVAQLVSVFEEVKRVLRKDGTLWVEVGDSFASGWACARRNIVGEGAAAADQRANRLSGDLKEKDLIGQPFLLAFALREAGWYWRNVCIWHKPNPMPESVRDRFTVSHSYVLLFSKSPRYFFDAEAVREESLNGGQASSWANRKHTDGFVKGGGEPGVIPSARNARSVWTIATQPLPWEHYAAFPEALAERCIKAGTSERGCCPECGAPWVREVEASYEKPQPGRSGGPMRQKGDAKRNPATRTDLFDVRLAKTVTTTGWRASCKCYWQGDGEFPSDVLPIFPCTVLDPFLGSGTTALVARRLGRKCIGIELSTKYAALSAERTKQLALPFDEVTSPIERAEASGLWAQP
jgi:DNA modification methylase